ncbi:PhzF family phenazine biosynthesis protein [Propioniciclava sp. MC1683]|uniref:PhzF family phenazine biosynthesis protein n=1 Tax=Propioniciclava sp. MC1683 TaxID=2760309 RepID=UPI0015FEF258|nr:PhzF family phenazine biosynthesis protein [Propioniciclava sp. MC1683]MBB1501880.1 PhzF family phenazine biosynthesis protein [Propioniciclava sp. MC1683]
MRPVDHVLRVFTDAEGRFGNFLGVFLDTAAWSDEFCQSRAADLGFSETVFVDDIRTGRIRIFTPTVKLGFAGHPTVGAAWLIDHLGHEVHTLECEVGTVYSVATQLGATVLADPAWSPPIDLTQVASPEVVDSYRPWEGSHEYVWAWIDEARGIVRARAFVDEVGIEEDEATGSAAILLAAHLNRALRIHQGVGSRIDVGPTHTSKVALSEDVKLDR